MHFFAIQTLFFCQTKAFSSSSNFQKIVTATTVISGLKTKKAGAKNAVLQVPRQTQLNAMPLALDAVSNFYKNSPYLAAFVTCGVKASAADLIAQSNEEKSADSSTVRRNFAFILYGGMYQGVIQEHIFNHIFPVLFGTSTSPMTVATKVIFDMLILSPFLCLPVAYLTKSAIFQYSPMEAIRRYISDIRERGLLTKYWSLWGPVQCLTFSIVPEHFRIAFIADVSFFWLILLSSISAKGEAAMEAEECQLTDGSTCRIDG